MYKKRIIVCLDVKDGRVTKGVKFQSNKDMGDPVELAERYYEEGVDELVFYDITASSEYRGIMIDVVRRTAKKIFVPFTVGGGIGSVKDMQALLLAGAEKVSVNSLAVKNPDIINEGVKCFGKQCIVLGMDILRDESTSSGYRVYIRGGRERTSLDALEWALEAESRGVGEIVLNSIDADGTKSGYDCEATKRISQAVSVPVVASGGAGVPEDLVKVLNEGKADAALVASMVHYGLYTIPQIKEYLAQRDIAVRTKY